MLLLQLGAEPLPRRDVLVRDDDVRRLPCAGALR